MPAVYVASVVDIAIAIPFVKKMPICPKKVDAEQMQLPGSYDTAVVRPQLFLGKGRDGPSNINVSRPHTTEDPRPVETDEVIYHASRPKLRPSRTLGGYEGAAPLSRTEYNYTPWDIAGPTGGWAFAAVDLMRLMASLGNTYIRVNSMQGIGDPGYNPAIPEVIDREAINATFTFVDPTHAKFLDSNMNSVWFTVGGWGGVEDYPGHVGGVGFGGLFDGTSSGLNLWDNGNAAAIMTNVDCQTTGGPDATVLLEMTKTSWVPEDDQFHDVDPENW